MKGNRRNFYRLLHVQPEAPTEIVDYTFVFSSRQPQ